MFSRQVEEFFVGIHGAEQVNFRCIKGKLTLDINGLYNECAVKQIKELNEQGYECYFAVNHGGFKDAQIDKITAVFADFDCGKDEGGNYHRLDVVARYKEDTLSELRQFPLKPSYVVETRNGLHVYWVLNAGATVEQFKECQRRLIAHFGADPKVKNPARLLRVPGTYWCKEPNNKFLTRLIECDGIRYDINTIIDTLPQATEQKFSEGRSNTDRKKGVILLSTSVTKTNQRNHHIDYIRARRADVLQTVLNPDPYIAHSHNEVFTYIKQNQDLREYLGVPYGTFNCVFHEDIRPSASVFTADSGDWMYVCHSDKCGVSGSIIEVTQHIMGTTDLGSVMRFLRSVYRIEYAETTWQKGKREILEGNIEFLESDKFRYGYPLVYERVRRYDKELKVMHNLAREFIKTEYFADSRGYPVFFSSISHIGRLCGKGDHQSKQVTNVIALLTYLGLVNKIDEADIPKRMLASAKRHAAIRRQTNIVSFYSIPPYNLKTMQFADNKSREFKDKNFSMRGWSHEMLVRALGNEEANRVYPQLKGKKVSRLSEDVTQMLEKSILTLIECKGWTTEAEVLSTVKLFFSGQLAYKERQLKAVMPELLDKYCLTRIRLNKMLKGNFDIKVSGYPFIIVKDLGEQDSRRYMSVKSTLQIQNLSALHPS